MEKIARFEFVSAGRFEADWREAFGDAACPRDALRLQPGDTVVMTGGNTSGESGNTNVIRIETI